VNFLRECRGVRITPDNSGEIGGYRMVSQRPCGGCGEQVKAGNGFYDSVNEVYMHSEKYNPKNRLHNKIKYFKDNLLVISGEEHTVSCACALAYTTRMEKAYTFNPERIKPVTILDDIKDIFDSAR
jgi:hypothetical protein